MKSVFIAIVPFVALIPLSCGKVRVETDGAVADGQTPIDAAAVIDADIVIDAAIEPDAAAATTCQTTTDSSSVVFVNRLAGTYTNGSSDSPQNNRSTISMGTSALTAWDVPAADFAAMQLCLAEVLAPFDVVVTDVEPTVEPYHEIVITNSNSNVLSDNFPGIPSIGQLGCTPRNNTISFVFTIDDNPLTVCQSAASMVGISQGLSRVVENCEDAMTFAFGCALQVDFPNASQTCGNNTPTPCSCTGQSTQNSFQRLLTTFGACPQ